MLSLEQFEKEIIDFLKQRGGKAPLVSIMKNFGWTVDGEIKTYDIIVDMQKQGLIVIGKNEFGIDFAYLK